ncbi:MAG TPA: hypothetical protein VGZ29_05705 [Terriglobia bacterium]|nr:hypothetical protein [Terriglobia bacterium]
MLRFTMTVKGTEKIDFAISGLVEKIQDWSALWPRVVDLIGARIMRPQFASLGIRGGTPWGPYRHTYRPHAGSLHGTKVEGAPATLRDTDKLYQSLAAHNEYTVEEFQPLSMKFGTTAPGFQWQTMRRYPARPIFAFLPEDNRAIASMMTATARNYARRLGFKVLGQTGRDITGAEALAAGVEALNGGPGAELASAI